ncbi:MAG: nitroreductase family protein [Halobacteriota archaeon]
MNGKLDKILEAGNYAPTATNAQPQRIYVIQSEQARAKVEKLLDFIIMPFVLFWFVIRRGKLVRTE